MRTRWLPPAIPLFLAAIVAAESPSTSPLPVSPFVEVVKLIGSDVGGAEEFGFRMGIDGDRFAVGVPGAPFPSARGAVYLFERDSGGPGAWGEVQKITVEEAQTGWESGRVVSLSGDRLAVGSYGAYGRGAVYLFEKDAGGPGAWGQVARIREPDEWEGWRFYGGYLEGDTLFVAQSLDSEVGPQAGAIYVFERDAGGPGNWGWVDKLFNSDAAGVFGETFAVDGDRFLSGARRLDGYSGAAYIFERDEGGQWWEVAKLTGDDPDLGEFGSLVALQGETAAVSVSPLLTDSAVYVFERDAGGPGSWGQVAKLVAKDGDNSVFFGYSVTIESDRIAIGAIGDDCPDGVGCGAVYVFERDAGGPGRWGQVAKLAASDRKEYDELGSKVLVSGRTIIAGARGDDDAGSHAGAVYVFEATARPDIAVAGSCPGEIVLELSGATPSGSVFVVQSESKGAGIVPLGSCAGVGLDLVEAKMLALFATDAVGSRTAVRTAPVEACGRYLQVVDAYTCGVGPVVQIP